MQPLCCRGRWAGGRGGGQHLPATADDLEHEAHVVLLCLSLQRECLLPFGCPLHSFTLTHTPTHYPHYPHAGGVRAGLLEVVLLCLGLQRARGTSLIRNRPPPKATIGP